MKIRVLFFASLRERVRAREIERSVADDTTVGELWKLLCDEYTQIQPMDGSVSFAVNQEYADRAHALRDGDEVALIPPVSGGGP